MNGLASVAWPVEKLGEAVEALARKSGVGLQLDPQSDFTTTLGLKALTQGDGEALGRWINAVALRLNLEAEPVNALYGELEWFLRNAGHALLSVPVEGETYFLALLGGSRNFLSVLTPDLSVRRIRLEVVLTALRQPLEGPLVAEVDAMLDEARVPSRRRERARAAIVRERLSSTRVGVGWLLRLSPGASFWRQTRHAGLLRRFLLVVGAYSALYLLWILSWWLIGRGALDGHTESGWLLAWSFLLFTTVPMRLLATWSQGLVAIGVGGLLKQRLLYGAFKLDPEEVRNQGAGQLLGRVFESEAMENLAVTGGFLGLFASIELVMAIVILGLGAGSELLMFLLLGWTGCVLLMSWRYFRRRRHWTDVRFKMTHDLIERMVGHRTRLAQEPRERWHEGEDRSLEHYLAVSRTMDRTGAMLAALAPRGWLVIGLLGLTPAFVMGRASSAELAISLGGIIFAFRALQKLATGLSHLAGALLAWKAVAPFANAAGRAEMKGSPDFALVNTAGAKVPGDGRVILDARDMVFRYPARSEPVLRDCNLQVRAGDRILIEGPSGGGKSTLGALLSGLRLPETGVILLGGLDQRTIGSEGWRRRVVLAPQFQENHVLTETFAFNLLMGRGWPARPEDLDEAEVICRELDLGDLLDRMPAGLVQTLGESGWQLSHGERSRLYIARALLQGADLVVLDESLAALDPDSFRQALQCVLNRASTLMLIAHP